MSPNATPAAYIARVAPLAQEAMRKTGIPASVMIAQSALETGWGQSELCRQGRNYFGMTVGDPAWAATDPFWGGAAYLGGRFRDYATAQDSFMDFASGFYTNPAYQDALVFRGDPAAFVLAEAPVYAPPSEPGNADYAHKVLSIIADHGLSRFDLPQGQLALDPRLVPPQWRIAA